MSTAIKSIFDAVAAWTFTVDSKVIRCRNYNELKDQLNQGDCPVRMLMIPGPETQLRHGTYMCLGGGRKLEWAIEDVLYWKPIASGQGLADFSEELLDYVVAYVDNIRTNGTPANKAIRDYRCIPSILKWGDVSYVGVRCLLVVEEFTL